MKIITTAVVAIKEENNPTKIIRSGKKTQKGQLAIGTIFVAIQETTPFFSNPMAIIIKHKIVKTELSENPETACSGVTIPKISKLKSIKNDVLSTVNFSLTNRPKAMIKIPLTIPISNVIYAFLGKLNLDKSICNFLYNFKIKLQIKKTPFALRLHFKNHNVL